MLRYKLRRYFEYVMLKTPVLSVTLLILTLLAAYFVSERTYVNIYHETTARSSNDHITAKLDEGFDFEEGYPYAYVRISDDSKRYKVTFHSLRKADYYQEVSYSFESGQVPEEIVEADDITLEIVKERITLTASILSRLTE